MSVLDQLSAQQRTLIVSLPYRAGLWVSYSDDEGGEEAHQKELTALANLIDGFSQQVFGSELLQYIMCETLKRKDEWVNWSGDLEKIPGECAEALQVLSAHVDEKDVKVYAMRLMELGEAVAVAFREHDKPSGAEKFKLFLAYALTVLKARLKKKPVKSFEQFLNISTDERRALDRLASALKVDYSI
ncbi:MAG TPA: hypothetical protein PK513_09715 [Alphaproteobacteria bacterium]|nr:hypothetical protein [Alphaproteobacteria bacterium]USO05819.1 MAG: hypothetical protein H6859_01040 [Rhodospirillales bacterium]HOO82767.1 hypothetical protein [Alphaproteobacteria bacterium]